MEKLKERITENGIDYILVGDYYIPDLKLPEENRPIGRYGRLHREYLKQEHPARYSSLILTGKLWTYLADLNEQAEERLDLIIEQMKATEGVTEELKARNQLEWVGRMNNIRNRAEEIIKSELIYICLDMKRPADYRLVFLIFPALQYRPNHGSGDFLLAGRSAFPQLCQFPYITDLIISQRIPQQIIRGNFQCVADIDKYRQAGNLCPAFNLPEIGCVYTA